MVFDFDTSEALLKSLRQAMAKAPGEAAAMARGLGVAVHVFQHGREPRGVRHALSRELSGMLMAAPSESLRSVAERKFHIAPGCSQSDVGMGVAFWMLDHANRGAPILRPTVGPVPAVDLALQAVQEILHYAMRRGDQQDVVEVKARNACGCWSKINLGRAARIPA